MATDKNTSLKIGFFTDDYLPSVDGVAMSIFNFKKDLEAKGHHVYVFTAKYSSRYSKRIFANFDYSKENNVIRFPSIPSVWFEGYQDTLPYRKKDIKTVESFDLDIVHIHTPGQLGILGVHISQKHNIPLISTYHTHLFKFTLEKKYINILPGSIALSLILPIVAKNRSMYTTILPSMKPSSSLTLWHNNITITAISILHQMCSVVIVPSEKVKKDLRLIDKKSNFIVLPTGINTQEAQAISQPLDRGLRPNNNTLLYVGRISVEKNISLLINMFKHLGKYAKTTKLLLIGPDMSKHTKKMMALANNLGLSDRIHFLGSIGRDQVLLAMSRADIFVFPSVTDTQGLVLGEAALMGLPIIYCDEGISALAKNEYNALLAKNNALDFAKKVKKLLSDQALRDSMSKNGLNLVPDNTTEVMSDKLIDIYKSVYRS